MLTKTLPVSGFVAVADNDQVNVNDIRRLGAFVASAFGRNQPGIATTVSPEEPEFEGHAGGTGYVARV